MYKIVQNYMLDNEYEYEADYATLSECQKVINEYIQDDKEAGNSFSYNVIDDEGEDIEEKQAELFRSSCLQAMRDIGLTEDEAEQQLEDYEYMF